MRTQHRQGTRHRDGLRFGLKVSGSVDNGGLLEYFFGKDGKACLEHGKFVQFLRDLHIEVNNLSLHVFTNACTYINISFLKKNRYAFMGFN